MNYTWPENLIIEIECAGKQVSNLIVFLDVFSSKNNFSIGPMLTNEAGVLILSREYIQGQLDIIKKEYPMDYRGNLWDSPGFELIIDDITELELRIEGLKLYYPENASNLDKAARTSANVHCRSYRKQWFMPLTTDSIRIDIAERGID